MMPTMAPLAPSVPRNGPVIEREPSYVMSEKRLTTPIRTTNPSALRAASLSRGLADISGSVAQHAEFRGQSCVEHLQVLLAQALHQLVGIRIRHHEIHPH